MAETRWKNFEDRLSKLEQALQDKFQALDTKIAAIDSSITNLEGAINDRFDQLVQLINVKSGLEKQKSVIGVHDSPGAASSEFQEGVTSANHRSERLDSRSSSSPVPIVDHFRALGLTTTNFIFPRFDGDNPHAWERKCEQYFQLHAILEEMKVSIASMHLEGKACIWYQDYQVGKHFIQWSDLISDLVIRFGDSGYDNVVGEFNKLQQLGSMLEYQERFEELKALMVSKNKGLTEEYFVQSYISGLKPELSSAVQMFSPETFIQVTNLSRLQETHLIAQGLLSKTPYQYHSTTKLPTHFSNHTSSHKTTQFSTNPTYSPPTSNTKSTTKQPHQYTSTNKNFTPPPLNFYHTNQNKPPNIVSPIRKLTYAEQRAPRAKGLCYHCDEVYKAGHNCTNPQPFLLVEDEDEDHLIPVVKLRK